jgi:hypothetical protein
MRCDSPLYLYARQYRDFTQDTNSSVRLGGLVTDMRGDATARLLDTCRRTRTRPESGDRTQHLGLPTLRK